MDLETDAMVPGGIKGPELKEMTEKGWVVYALEEDTEFTAEFENPERGRYTRTGLLPPDELLLVNPKEEMILIWR
jgi:hypothetical protein